MSFTCINPNAKVLHQEVVPISDVDSEALFSTRHVEHIFTRATPALQDLKLRLLLTFIQPNDHANSNFCFNVVTVLMTPTDNVLIIGFDQTKTHVRQEKKTFLENYFTLLSLHPICERASMIVAMETNFGRSELVEWADLAKHILQKKHANMDVLSYEEMDSKLEPTLTFKETLVKATSAFHADIAKEGVYSVQEVINTREKSVKSDFSKLFMEQLSNVRLKDDKVIHKHDMATCLILGVYVCRYITTQLLLTRVNIVSDPTRENMQVN